MAWSYDELIRNSSPDVLEDNAATIEGVKNLQTNPQNNPYLNALALMSEHVKELNPEIVEELKRAGEEERKKQYGGNKYNAIPTETDDGKKFPSMKEANEYLALRLLVRAGVIKDLILQPRFILQRANKAKGIKQVKYTPDFQYFDIEKGVTTIVETKGFKTTDFIVRKNLFEQWLLDKHPDWIYIVK